MITSNAMPYLFESARNLIRTTWPSALVALAAWISIVVAIDPGGSYPSMPEGPGLTVDEIFNVEQGVYLVEQCRALGWLNLIPSTSLEAFRPENNYNPDHPPLGRYWLGVHHHLAWWLAPPMDPDGPFVTACARTGSATAFALTVWLIGAFAARRFTPPGDFRGWAGGMTSAALVLMPRVYGHAHLASLETITNLTCTAAVLAVAAWWSGPTLPTRRAAFFVGLLMGLALLTKIQAILIPIPVIAWALCRWRQKSIVPLMIWGTTAVVLFYAAWPYLWLNPIGHLFEYLGRTTNRATLHCFYLGTRYPDKLVPWHYPFVMFAVTVPVVLHLLGGFAIASRIRTVEASRPLEDLSADRWRGWLLMSCALFPLVTFALPGVAVYDGERLFLTVFPLWAILVGHGAVRGMQWLARSTTKGIAITFACALLLIQFGTNLRSHPSYLSYYSIAVGGTAGADKLGLELNYWGDSLTRTLLTEASSDVGEYTGVQILPSLHPFQNDDLLRQSPILRRRQSTAAASDRSTPLRLAFRRRADFSDVLFMEYWHSHASRHSGRPLGTYLRPPKE